MKKFLLTLIATMMAVGSVVAQDILIRKTGDELQVKVLEVSDSVIKYKKWNMPDGPTYSVSPDELFMIKYADGSKDMFADKKVATKEETSPRAPQAPKLAAPTIREKRFEIGVRIAPTLNVITVLPSYENNIDGDTGFRFFGTLGTTFTYYFSKYESNCWFLHGGLQYALRGSKFELEDRNLTIRTDYFEFEAGVGVRGSLCYWITSLRGGVLTSSKLHYKYDNDISGKSNIYKHTAPFTFSLVEQFGFCIGKHIDLGWEFGFTPHNVIKPEFWNGENDSLGLYFGLAFTYRFKIK